MKTTKFLVSIVLIMSIFLSTGCATVFGGHIDHCQRDKEAFTKETGLKTRHIRWGAFILDILIPPSLINLGIDFATRAIYKPCEWYSPNNSQATTPAASVDVVYLKDGSIIKGTIVEQVPNKSVKIKTKDGSTFNYNMEQIEKITKE
jgi:hypothetical protein